MRWNLRPGIVVRLLGLDGSYPSFSIRTHTHVYVPGPDLTWMAVVQPSLPEDWEFGEVNWLAPEEIRLIASLSLCERNPWDIGYPVIGRGASRYLRLGEGTDLSSPDVFHTLEHAASELVHDADVQSIVRHSTGSSPYKLRDVGTVTDAINILTGIDASDQLLLAGLARFLGGSRLFFSCNEPEEAAISFYVAMGAALEFLRLWLCEQEARSDVSFEDVYAYLSSVYPPGNEIAEVFRDLYEERLVAIHPASRLGEYWAPPLMADDLYWLRKHLIVLYRHIALGGTPSLG